MALGRVLEAYSREGRGRGRCTAAVAAGNAGFTGRGPRVDPAASVAAQPGHRGRIDQHDRLKPPALFDVNGGVE